MMALLSNWDLYDKNNAIWKEKDDPDREIYEVTDLGASFGKKAGATPTRVQKAT
jgi:hypothetical protein